MNILFCQLDRYIIHMYVEWWDRLCGNFWIERYFRILSGTRTWRLRYTFLKYPVYIMIQLSQQVYWNRKLGCYLRSWSWIFYTSLTNRYVNLRNKNSWNMSCKGQKYIQWLISINYILVSIRKKIRDFS